MPYMPEKLDPDQVALQVGLESGSDEAAHVQDTMYVRASCCRSLQEEAVQYSTRT
jgi:hypothetical protein